MPIFIKIIQRQASSEAPQFQSSKKIAQFCKETIVLLAMWFPKCFYDDNTLSWFKKAVNKYNITIKFIVYYTN